MKTMIRGVLWVTAGVVLGACAGSEEVESASLQAAEPPVEETVMPEPAGPEEVTLVETAEGLASEALVSDGEARAIVLSKLWRGSITQAEIREDGGRLLYVYGVEVEGRGLRRVMVDARSGEVIRVEEPFGGTA